MRRVISVAVAASLVVAQPAFPWWETGHRAVARLAAAHITPAARTRLARILETRDDAQTVADALAQASTWADETKNQTNTGSWHYIDLTLEDRKSDISERCPDSNCAPARVRLFAAQLSSTGSAARTQPTRWSELDALRYVVHLVGDIHQPLHTISDADLGGNCELLDPPIAQAKNLHALWDGVLVNFVNPDDRALAAELEQQVQRLNLAEQRKLAAGNVNDWVWQSHELAIRVIYKALQIPVEPVEFPPTCKDAPAAITDFHPQVGSVYIDAMKPVVREQLMNAGLRLARVLNDSL